MKPRLPGAGPAPFQSGIAIIGMAGRFPGAKDLDCFWDNLHNGVESISFFSDEELREAGVSAATLSDPCYVKAAPVLDGVDLFDALFFDCSPREARITDPQHRLFLECAWEALENAGYDPLNMVVPVGVFGGAGGLVSSYLLYHARADDSLVGPTGSLQHITNDKDFLTTHVSYKLNLKGPSVNVQSACSTSLVAVHIACQSLLGHECDMALAGGVAIRVPHKAGYFFEEGGIVSPDGHCRAFDAAARGTVFGSGVGLVVLKRLADALADGDPIRATIKGSAVNNDGGSKLSYTAASEAGQASAIAEALAMAGFDPETVTLIEAHGTATALGDPVEVSALTKVFRSRTTKSGLCAIGSVKTNIGHPEAAAGIAGLIKAVLSLEHRQIPASLHFQKPNPRINFESSPFFVNNHLHEWHPGSGPRRAGVNSLGIGGTNAFVALEEAPALPLRPEGTRAFGLFCLSAKTEKALVQLVQRYIQHFDRFPNLLLSDVCYTAQIGRSPFAERLAVVADSLTGLRQKLAGFSLGNSVPGVFRGRVVGGAPSQVAPRTNHRDDDPNQLESLGKIWVQGAEVNWPVMDRNGPPRRVALPTYPFQRERYWIDSADIRPNASLRDGTTAPPKAAFPGRRLPSPLRDIQFECPIGVPTWPLLGEHRVYDQIVVPGAWHLAMVLAGVRQAFGTSAVTLRDIVFPRALVLVDDEVRSVQLIFTPADPAASFQVWSLGQSGTWQLHAQGELVEGQSDGTGEHPRLEELEQRCSETNDATEFYQRMRDRHIDLGLSFQWNARVGFSNGATVSRVRRPVPDADGFVLHPGLIDACIQAPIAQLPPTYLPLSIESCKFLPSSSVPSWFHGRFRSVATPDPEVMTGDLCLFDEAGKPVLEMVGLSLKRASRAALAGGADAKNFENWLYCVEWRPRPLPAVPPTKDGTWLILADSGGTGQALESLLQVHGQTCVLVVRDHTNLRQQLHDALGSANTRRNLRGIVYLGGFDDAAQRALRPWEAVLELVHELAAAETLPSPRLWLVTRGAQTVGTELVAPALAQAPLWGLGRVIASEHPEVGCTLVDLDPCLPVGDPRTLFEEVLAADGEDQVAYCGGQRWVARLVRMDPKTGAGDLLPIPEGRPFQLQIASRGVLDNLQIRPGQRRSPTAGMVEIRVRAAGLNFRDVLNALGTYPGDPGELGLECAGEVSAVGPDVEGLRVGEAVLAVAFGSFGTFVTTPAALVHRKPDRLTFEEAATIPVTFLTAHYALNHLARMSAGQRILIHAATGGVGLAAVQLARAAGAEVFATAGNPEKHAYLHTLGIEHVMSSRCDEFAGAVMERTGGRGVDVVLNSLSGNLIRAGLSVLRPGGHFIELGKIGIWDEQRVAAFRSDISFSTMALDVMFREKPAFVGALLGELTEGFAAGRLQPLPVRVFPIAAAIRAFRFMAQAKHIGKLALSLPAMPGGTAPGPTHVFRADATYLVTGGLGGLGLLVARWLARHGARHLLLVGRKVPSPTATKVLDELETAGVEVRVERVNVAEEEQVARLLSTAAATMPPLRGVIHAAGTLDDGVLLQQNAERFAQVMAPKVDGAWNLHVLTRETPLDFFVLFSSMASILGSAGQANYAAANAGLDALAHLRRAQKLPAVSVNWGPWAEAGMAASLGCQGEQRFAARGIDLISPEAGLEALGRIMLGDSAQVAVLPIDWTRFVQQFPAGHEPALLRELGGCSRLVNQPASPVPRETRPQERAQEASGETLRDRLRRQVQDQTARVLGLDSADLRDGQQPLTDLGLDSLMAVELGNALGKSNGCRLPTELIFNRPTIDALIDYLAAKLTGESSAGEQAPTGSSLLVPIQPGGSKPPLFCVHGIGGETLFLAPLARHLAADQPFYGLRARGLDGVDEPDTDIRTMAARYIEAIRTVVPHGPYFLGGFSSGGTVAFEMGQQLRAQGHEVALLAIFDHIPPKGAKTRPLWHPRTHAIFLQNLLYWIVDDMLQTRPDRLFRRARGKLRVSWNGFFRKMRGANGEPETIDPEAVFSVSKSKLPEGYLRLVQIHYRALMEYQPHKYPGRVDLFRARTARLGRPSEPDLGWGVFADGGVRIHLVPGTHASMVQQPHVRALAEKLTACLNDAQVPCGRVASS